MLDSDPPAYGNSLKKGVNGEIAPQFIVGLWGSAKTNCANQEVLRKIPQSSLKKLALIPSFLKRIKENQALTQAYCFRRMTASPLDIRVQSIYHCGIRLGLDNFKLPV